MAYTIITNECEGCSDCVEACPTACIHPGFGKNAKGASNWNWIDFSTCINCGICQEVCPVDAILSEARPDLQIMVLDSTSSRTCNSFEDLNS